jgi:hypothetical protein
MVFVGGFKTSPVTAVIDTQMYRFQIALKWSKSGPEIVYLFLLILRIPSNFMICTPRYALL